MRLSVKMNPSGFKFRAMEHARALESDVHKAVNAYSVGDRSKQTLTTLASAKVLADALGVQLPVPHGTDAKTWPDVLSGLVKRFSGLPTKRGK